MGQLTNLPLWMKVLTLGGFMFAGGILMTRAPLIPVIILSFFCLHRLLNASGNIPNFGLQQTSLTVWAIIYIVYMVLAVLYPAVEMIGRHGWESEVGAFFWVMILSALLILASFIPACIKWLNLIETLPGPMALWCGLFVLGCLFGILIAKSTLMSEIRFNCWAYIMPFLLTGACACCLYAISKGQTRWGIVATSISWILIALQVYLYKTSFH